MHGGVQDGDPQRIQELVLQGAAEAKQGIVVAKDSSAKVPCVCFLEPEAQSCNVPDGVDKALHPVRYGA